jgi:sporulation protein YlmC with PRC-barrel domain
MVLLHLFSMMEARNHMAGNFIMLSLKLEAQQKRPWQLIGSEVVTTEGEFLGMIEDVVVDKSTNQIAQVVVGRAGLTGAAESFVRMPWKDIKFSNKTEAYVVQPKRWRMKATGRIAQH